MARQKRNSPVFDDADNRAAALKTIDQAMDYGNGVSLTALNTVIAANLGIVGTAQTAPDAATLQPQISVSLVSGQVFVKWGWGGNRAWLDSCEILVDRGDGKGFVFLTIDTTPTTLTPRRSRPPAERAVEMQSHLPRRRRPPRPVE